MVSTAWKECSLGGTLDAICVFCQASYEQRTFRRGVQQPNLL
jgi:hypothetical protein